MAVGKIDIVVVEQVSVELMRDFVKLKLEFDRIEIEAIEDSLVKGA